MGPGYTATWPAGPRETEGPDNATATRCGAPPAATGTWEAADGGHRLADRAPLLPAPTIRPLVLLILHHGHARPDARRPPQSQHRRLAPPRAQSPQGRARREHQARRARVLLHPLCVAPSPPACALTDRRGLAAQDPKDNFRPESVDATKPGTVQVHDADDGKLAIKMTRPSTKVRHSLPGVSSLPAPAHPPARQENETHRFKGRGMPMRDVECVLIFDEDTNVRLCHMPLPTLPSTCTVLNHSPADFQSRESRCLLQCLA